MNIKKPLKLSQSVTLISILVFILTFSANPNHSIPVSGHTEEKEETVSTVPNYQNFLAAVENGNSNVVRGVYVPDVLALRVLQQPDNNAGYVSSVIGVATQFHLAAQSGVTGLLAHNYLSGFLYFDLVLDQEVSVVYGDGSTQRYLISEIYQYQALQPNSPFSDFIDLDTKQKLTSTQLYNFVYAGEHHLTFQTCIAKDGNLTWGRLFVIATPIDES